MQLETLDDDAVINNNNNRCTYNAHIVEPWTRIGGGRCQGLLTGLSGTVRRPLIGRFSVAGTRVNYIYIFISAQMVDNKQYEKEKKNIKKTKIKT